MRFSDGRGMCLALDGRFRSGENSLSFIACLLLMYRPIKQRIASISGSWSGGVEANSGDFISIRSERHQRMQLEGHHRQKPRC